MFCRKVLSEVWFFEWVCVFGVCGALALLSY